MQKKILALHDLSGFGRSSLVPIIAVTSAMGHQCVPVPTAIFSAHTAIAGYTFRDLTTDIAPMVAHYATLALEFDAIYSGFLSSAEQMDAIAQSITSLRTAQTLVLVDPVMGDNGTVYRTYTPAMCAKMGQLCHLADVITPNLTEAAILLDKSPTALPADARETADWARTLAKRYQAHVVLTGVDGGAGTIGVLCCENDTLAFFEHARERAYYPGTGDLFAAVLLGSLLRSYPLADAAKQAACFVRECIAYTATAGTDTLHGVQFEPLLRTLFPKQTDTAPM